MFYRRLSRSYIVYTRRNSVTGFHKLRLKIRIFSVISNAISKTYALCCCNRKQAQNRLENPTELQDVKTTFFHIDKVSRYSAVHLKNLDEKCTRPTYLLSFNFSGSNLIRLKKEEINVNSTYPLVISK